MKAFVIFVCLKFCFVTCYCQTRFSGIEAYFGSEFISYEFTDEYHKPYDYTINTHSRLGALAKFNIKNSRRLQLKTGIETSTLNYSYNNEGYNDMMAIAHAGTIFIPGTADSTSKPKRAVVTTSRTTASYFSMPLIFQYTITKNETRKSRFFTTAGITAGVRTSAASYVQIDYEINTPNLKTELENKYKDLYGPFMVSLNFGLGIDIRLSKKLGLVYEHRVLNFYLNNFANKGPDIHNYSGGLLSLGYTFN